nr:MAG: hypothetical protein [Wufeng shrew polycipivirus 5]
MYTFVFISQIYGLSMNNQEPLLSQPANDQLSTTGEPLVEQPGIPIIQSVPRPVSLSHFMYTWQPMGIRVTVNIPFVGNDEDFLFMIRNGPLIPRWNKQYADPTEFAPGADKGFPSPLTQYGWNNMRNVYASTFEGVLSDSITITQYDYPPPLSTLAHCFRRWRGDMQYRIRTVAGFATQGYIFCAPVKNVFSPIAVYNEYRVSPWPRRADRSYRDEMINSYVMADTSMFRHMEVTVPYEYPVPYYDQYAWMARRLSPRTLTASTGGDKGKTAVLLEPHGDNWLGVGLRGELDATKATGKIIFELEYRAVEGFQFADPGVPLEDMTHTYFAFKKTKPLHLVKRTPDSTLKSDGLNGISKNTLYLRVPPTTTTTTPDPNVHKAENGQLSYVDQELALISQYKRLEAVARVEGRVSDANVASNYWRSLDKSRNERLKNTKTKREAEFT